MKFYRVLTSFLFYSFISFSVFGMEETEIALTWPVDPGFNAEVHLIDLFNILKKNKFDELIKEDLDLTQEENRAFNDKKNTFPMELASELRFQLLQGNPKNQSALANAMAECIRKNPKELVRDHLNMNKETLITLLQSVMNLEPHKDTFSLDILKINPPELRVVLTLEEFKKLKEKAKKYEKLEEKSEESFAKKPKESSIETKTMLKSSSQEMKKQERSASSRALNSLFKKESASRDLDIKKIKKVEKIDQVKTEDEKKEKPQFVKRRSISDPQLMPLSTMQLGPNCNFEWVSTDKNLMEWVKNSQVHTKDLLSSMAIIKKILDNEKREKLEQEFAKRLEKTTEQE